MIVIDKSLGRLCDYSSIGNRLRDALGLRVHYDYEMLVDCLQGKMLQWIDVGGVDGNDYRHHI